MSDDLSEYEKKRLDNIAKNQNVLISLGLADGANLLGQSERKKEQTKPRQQKRGDGEETLQPIRILPKRGAQKVTNYDFSHHYNELEVRLRSRTDATPMLHRCGP